MEIRRGDFDDERILSLLRHHFEKCHEVTPAGSGFEECAPFGSYQPDPNSVFLTRVL